MYKVTHNNKEYFVKANDALDAIACVHKYRNDERLSPMTYRKLKELGYASEQWRGKTQEWANSIIRNRTAKSIASSSASNTGNENSRKAERTATESSSGIANTQYKSKEDKNRFLYHLGKLERYRDSDKKRYERGGDKYNTKEELADRIRYANRVIRNYKKLSKLAQENDYVITMSPYSESAYAVPKGEEVSWGYKPEGSYRVSNHWNWKDYSGTHCPTNTGEDFGEALAIFKNGKYYKI